MWRLCVLLVVAVVSSAVHAAPLAYFSLEGRKQGSNDPFSANVEVVVGDVIEYRLLGRVAPAGTTNRFLYPHSHVRPDGAHGFNSLSFAIRQNPSDGIYVDLATPVNLDRGGWGAHFTVRGGTPTVRIGQNEHDLLDIRPVQNPGVFGAGSGETIFTGLFEVTDVAGATGLVRPMWGPVAGGGAYYGKLFYLTPGGDERFSQSEASDDPVAHFTPLSLTSGLAAVPESGALVLLSAAVLPFALLHRRHARLRSRVIAGSAPASVGWRSQ